MSLITSALLALAIAVPSPIPEKQAFTQLIVVDNFALNVDTESFKFLGTPELKLIGLDMQLVIISPLKHPDLPKAIKYYVNSVAVDCKNDVLHVIISRAFGVDNDLLFVSPAPSSIPNPRLEDAPVTLILRLVCPPLEKIERENKSKISAKSLST